MSAFLPSGNYTREVWSEVCNYLLTQNLGGYLNFIRNDERLAIAPESPYFLLVDIHGFSAYCKRCERRGNTNDIADFLRAFFHEMSKYMFQYEAIPIKYIGDAILAINSRKQILRQCANKLLDLYHDMFLPSYPNTDIVALITWPKVILKGFAEGLDYVDYSYWGSGLNYLFKMAKTLDEGHVYYIKRDGTAVNYDY